MRERRLQGDVDRLYHEAMVKLSLAVNDPERGVLWAYFVADQVNPYVSTDYATYSRNNKCTRLEVAIPNGVPEANVRLLFQSYIRDGFWLDSCEIASPNPPGR